MKRLITALILILLLLMSASCSPSEQGKGAPDDIVTTPDGPAYRANVHEVGKENPWPSIESKTIVLGEGVDAARITYRNYIETKAGEVRNNIFSVEIPQRDISDVALEVSNIPSVISIPEGEKWYGPRRIKIILVIEIFQQVKQGEYNFEVSVKIDGKAYGTVPCIIRVLE